MADKVFGEGFFFRAARQGAPDFIKGHLGIRVDEAVAFLEKYKKADGFVNLDLLKSKDGSKLYFTLNDWKPEGGTESTNQETF